MSIFNEIDGVITNDFLSNMGFEYLDNHWFKRYHMIRENEQGCKTSWYVSCEYFPHNYIGDCTYKGSSLKNTLFIVDVMDEQHIKHIQVNDMLEFRAAVHKYIGSEIV